MRWIIAACVFSLLLPAYAQVNYIDGQVNSGAFLGPVGKVHVRMGKYSTKTDYDGKFSLRFSENEPIIINHTNYNTQKVPFANVSMIGSNTFYITPTSGLAAMVLESAEVEKIYDPEFEHVFDYTFLNDTLVILAYMNLNKAQQTHTKPYVNCTLTALRFGKLIDRKVLPNFVEKLYTHPNGNLYFQCIDTSYVLNRKTPKLTLEGFDFHRYKTFTSLAYAENENGIFYGYPYAIIPQVTHKMYSKSRDEAYLLEMIQNHAYFDKVADDYAMLTESEKENTLELEASTGINRELFSTFLRSFYKVRDLTLPYAPGYAVGDGIVIFDNLNNKANYYDASGFHTGSINMYHNNLYREELVKMIQDPFTENVFTLHDKGGVRYLRKVNVETASTGRPFKLKYPFAENVKVFENYVYYLYKSARDEKLNHLVREKLPFRSSEKDVAPDAYYVE